MNFLKIEDVIKKLNELPAPDGYKGPTEYTYDNHLIFGPGVMRVGLEGMMEWNNFKNVLTPHERFIIFLNSFVVYLKNSSYEFSELEDEDKKEPYATHKCLLNLRGRKITLLLSDLCSVIRVIENE